MGQYTLADKIREWIGGIGWHIFLWSIGRTAEQYLFEIEQQAIHDYLEKEHTMNPVDTHLHHWKYLPDNNSLIAVCDVCGTRANPTEITK